MKNPTCNPALWCELLAGIAIVLVCGVAFAEDPAARASEPISLAEAETRFRERWGGFSAEEIAPEPVADEDNRAVLVRAAVERWRELKDEVDHHDKLWGAMSSEFDLDLVARQCGQLESVLLGFDDALYLLDGVAGRSGSNYGLDYHSAVHGVILIDMGRLVGARGLLAVTRGQAAEALDDVSLLLAVSASFAEEPDGILQLLRHEYERIALGLLREAVAAGLGDAERLERLQEEIEAVGTPSSAVGFIRSRLAFGLSLIDARAEKARSENWETPMVAETIEALQARHLTLADALLEYASTPAHLRGAPPEIEDEPEDDPENYHEEIERSMSPGWGWAQARALIVRSDVNAVMRNLARVALAVERHREASGGVPPRSLSELVPEYLDELPDDEFTGEPFEYRVTEEGYRLAASNDASDAWIGSRNVPALDWSRPRR